MANQSAAKMTRRSTKSFNKKAALEAMLRAAGVPFADSRASKFACFRQRALL